MLKDGIGVIYDLKFENFLPGGYGYIKERKDFKKEGFSTYLNGRKSIENRINFNFSFAKKIQEIDNQRKEKTKIGNVNYLNKKTTEFFKEAEEYSILDIVIFPQTGLIGIDKEAISLYSIIYIEIKNNTKIGFLVNKNLVSILIPDEITKVNKNKIVIDENKVEEVNLL